MNPYPRTVVVLAHKKRRIKCIDRGNGFHRVSKLNDYFYNKTFLYSSLLCFKSGSFKCKRENLSRSTSHSIKFYLENLSRRSSGRYVSQRFILFVLSEWDPNVLM